MQPYNFALLENKWKKVWEMDSQVVQNNILNDLPKYYILNMFPFPSGSGLHVGHYLGYVGSDILARYYRHCGYHVMNPMGFDAFGLPSEQFAIETGQHPAIFTNKNIKTYIEQLQKIGLDFNWERSVNTSDSTYYKWTQWIFLQMFNAWYNVSNQKAEPLSTLIDQFSKHGNYTVEACCDEDVSFFSAEEWAAFSEAEQQAILMKYRLAYLKDSLVNWCDELGTVLANEEVRDGFSTKGHYPVIRKKMKQWHLRITAYAERLLAGLETLDWPVSTKKIQCNWIGRSEGIEITFRIQGQAKQSIVVFTTRPETIFGACFIALAPEHPFVQCIIDETKDQVLMDYVKKAKNRSDCERLSDSTFLSGAFTGVCAVHPFTGAPLSVWVADYVLPHYGTGAIMGVPMHDRRDYVFAQSFELLSLPVIEHDTKVEDDVYEGKEGKMINSMFLNGLSVQQACGVITQKLVDQRIGKRKVNYKLQDTVFSRQRYWGEPFPIFYKDNGFPYAMDENQLPLVLPQIDSYKPNSSGVPPLGNAINWHTVEGYPFELNTMPSWAGSSWYFLRYMDPHNSEAFLDKEQERYWKQVDCYIGGAEHATGHLLYARFWTKVLYDLGYINMQEPFPKLFHQGIMQSFSAFVYRIKHTNQFVSFNLKDQYEVVAMYVPIEFVRKDILDIEAFKQWRPEFKDATFILEEGQYVCGRKIEKMSKSKHNFTNPDTFIAQYGADALRLYLMFLGPLEHAKPWNLSGIEGISRFLNKVWVFVYQAKKSWNTLEGDLNMEIAKTVHRTIKKVTEDIQRFAFNTAISSLMVCLNALSNFDKVPKSVVEDFILLLEPFAPYITAELWEIIGHKESIKTVAFPLYNKDYVKETEVSYPIAINGKVRTEMTFPSDVATSLIEKQVLEHEIVKKWVQDKVVQKIIIVPCKMVNIVV